MTARRPSPRHPANASEEAIERAARAIFEGRPEEAARLAKAATALHTAIRTVPAGQFALADEVQALKTAVFALAERQDFMFDFVDRLFERAGLRRAPELAPLPSEDADIDPSPLVGRRSGSAESLLSGGPPCGATLGAPPSPTR